jgi:hypothetical protein
MYAVINIPGSSHFCFYGPASKAECADWMEGYVREAQRTEQVTSLLPQRLVSNKQFEAWRWLDGRRVCDAYQYNAKIVLHGSS